MTPALRPSLKSRGAALFASFALFSLAFWSQALLPGRALFHDMLLRLFHPNFEFIAASLRAGHFPFWNPYLYGGVPFLANFQSALFYPATWFSIAGHFSAQSGWDAWAHSLVAAVSLFFWARWEKLSVPGACAAALLGSFNGTFILHYAYPSNLHAMAVAPLVLHGARRLAASPSPMGWRLLATGTALQVFAGHPQFVAYTWFAVLVLTVPRRAADLGRVAAGLATGLLISAIQWLPSLPVLAETPRSAGPGLGTAWATVYSLPPWEGLRMLFIPLWSLFWKTTSGDPNILGFYIGVPGLILAAAGVRRGRHAVPFVILSLAAGLLALGRHLPLYDLVLNHVPLLRLFRFPAQILFLAGTGCALLAGMGIDRISGPRSRWALVSLVALDLWGFGRGAVETVDASVYEAEPSTSVFLHGQAPGRIMASPQTRSHRDWAGADTAGAWGAFKEALISDVGMAWGLPDADGNEVVRYAEYDRIMDDIGASPRSAWLDWMGVRYILSLAPVPGSGFRKVFQSSIGVYENDRAVPRVYVPRRAILAGREEAFDRIARAGGPAGGDVFLEAELPTEELSCARASVSWEDDGPNRLKLRINADGPAWVVVTDVWAPGWTAKINGEPAPLFRANFRQRALRVPSGASSAALAYVPPLLGYGAGFSALGLALLAVGVLWLRSGRKRDLVT